MATRDRTPVNASVLTGVHVATCVTATQQNSKAGNPMIVWEFSVDGHPYVLKHWTLLRSTSIHETVVALGLDPLATKLSAAPGRQCRVVVSFDGQFHSIDSCKSL
jgi:hypothetical protein